MGHTFAEKHFSNFEEVGKWLNEWFSAKEKQFFWQGIHNIPERWAECIEADGQYFESMKNEFPLKIICFFTTKHRQRLMHTPGKISSFQNHVPMKQLSVFEFHHDNNNYYNTNQMLLTSLRQYICTIIL